MASSKTDIIAHTLGERITGRTYPPGSTLPSERDLTEEFGVSRVTVRNALGRLESQRLIARTAGKGTYVLDHDAPTRSVPVTPGTIALVSSQLTPSVASPIAAGCSSAALGHGVQLLLCDTGAPSFAEAQAKELRHLKSIYEQGVAGVVMWWQGGEASIPWLRKLLDDGRAVVMVDRRAPQVEADFVGIDDAAAAAEAVRHLARLGRRRIGCVVHALGISTSADRLTGYRNGLIESGLPFDESLTIVVEEGRHDSGQRAAASFAAMASMPDALVAVNDYVAIDVIEALAERGASVPEQVAVVGFADMEVAKHYRVPLTTVHQPFWEIGESAVNLVTERLKSGRTYTKRVLLPTSLVIRRSCGAGLAGPRGEGR